MAEVCDQARMIQRVIDDKYPNTRVLWQSVQQQVASRPYVYAQSPTTTFNRGVPTTVTRSWNASRTTQDSSGEQLDKVVQRVIDLRYPDTRLIWIRSRDEPASLQTPSQRKIAADQPVSSVGLPGLNPTDDPWKQAKANRAKTVSFPQ
jgi:hypothetical protein